MDIRHAMIWLALSLHAPVWACVLSGPTHWQLPDYDPQSVPSQVGTQHWRIHADGTVQCRGQVVIELLDTQAYTLVQASRDVALQFELRRQPQDTAPLGPSPAVLQRVDLQAGPLAPSSALILPLWSHSPSDQWVPAGTYERRMRLSLQDDWGRTLSELPLTLTQTVQPRVSLRWANSGGAQVSLDFGTLSRGQLRTAELSVQRNTLYSLHINSQNAGVLRNARYPEDTVPYRLEIDGRPVNPHHSTMVPEQARVSGSTAWHSLRVEILDVQRVRAGIYQDYLSLTIQAQ